MQIYYSHRYSVYLKQNGTVSSFSVLSIFHSESYNFAHENHNCPFCSPAFFLKIFYQPGHYNVPGRVLSTGFMVKFIVNPGKILCFTKVDVYVAAFALIVSMMFFSKRIRLKSPTINASARIFSIYCRTFILFILF